MDTQNVSAQLYFKQLPVTDNNDSVVTDSQIEEAFQKQLNLSEYYKSPEVFESIKKESTILENKNDKNDKNDSPEGRWPQPNSQPEPPSVKPVTPVGPTDFLRKFIKESFGSTNDDIGGFILLFVIGMVLLMSFSYWIQNNRSATEAFMNSISSTAQNISDSFKIKK